VGHLHLTDAEKFGIINLSVTGKASVKNSEKNKDLLHTFQTWYRSTIRNSKYRWAIVLGSLVYLLSPVDIAPDFIPVLGWVDDGLIATLLITEVSQLILDKFQSQKRDYQGSEPISAEDFVQNFTKSNSEKYATETAANVIDVQAVSIG